MTGPHLFLFIGIMCAAVLLLVLPVVLGLRMRGRAADQSSARRSESIRRIDQLLADSGFFYDSRRDIFSSLRDCWQRRMGYCRVFDDGAASFHMVMDCEPIRFTYGGKEWLIQLWKGQYGITTGGEIGVYNLPKSRESNSYDLRKIGESTSRLARLGGYCYESASDTEMLPLSMTLYKNGRKMFRTHGTHWWLTGFVLGEFSQPEDLVMHAQIRFPDLEMRDAFVDALVSTGYQPDEYAVRRSTVQIRFAAPHTPQPSSRGSLRESLVQKTNETNCALFHFFTRKQRRTLDKLVCLETMAPELFTFCMESLYGKQFFDLVDREEDERPDDEDDGMEPGCKRCRECNRCRRCCLYCPFNNCCCNNSRN